MRTFRILCELVGLLASMAWSVLEIVGSAWMIVVLIWLVAASMFGVFEITTDPCCRLFAGFPE